MNGYRRATRSLIPTLLLCIVLAYGCSTQDRGAPSSTGGLRTVEGRVVAIDLSQMAVDGPGRVRLETDDGAPMEVLVAACEGPCSQAANEVLMTLGVDDRVRTRGDQRDGDLVLYDDELHFLEVLE